MSRPAPAPASTSAAAAAGLAALRESGPLWWRHWDHAAIEQACTCAPLRALADEPELAYWRGLAAFMREDAQALAYLEQAYLGHIAKGDATAATVVAHAALVICQLDSGAMDGGSAWHARVDSIPHTSPHADTLDALSGLWLRMGVLVDVTTGTAATPSTTLAATWLQAQLMPLRAELSPDERLIAALVLIEYHFAAQRFEQFDLLANLVENPAQFDAASPLLRARWVHIYGYAHYQAGNHATAEKAWFRALAITEKFNIGGLHLLTTLALAKLLLDRGRIDQAEILIGALRPQWGGGRTTQLIQLQQLRARVQLLRGQPVKALATLEEALRLGDQAATTSSEHASCLTDQAQVFIALDREHDALALLARLAQDHSGRDAQVYGCLHALLKAWLHHHDHPVASTRALELGLQLAQQARYTMFFRLLPPLAAALCALALQRGVEPRFVDEVIRSRKLPAPAEAGARWPWPLWLRMLGGFELHRDGAVLPATGKPQQKPLELLRLIACERHLSIGTQVALQALWPQADEAAAHKSLEMAVLRLRRLLGDATLLVMGDGKVGLDASRASSDVQQRRAWIERIEALAMRPAGHGADAASGDECRELCRELLQRVLELSAGELLPGAPDAPWLEAERQRARQDTVRAALATANVLERSPGHIDHAERELLEAALRIEPLAEALVRRLMQAHARAGQRGDALRVFEAYRQQMNSRGAPLGTQLEAHWRALLSAGQG